MFQIPKNPVTYVITSHSFIHLQPLIIIIFIIINHITLQRTMPPATNLLLYDDSLQSDSLGDACLIAVLASIMMLLHLIEAYLIKTKKKSRRRDSTYRHIIRR